MKRMGLVLRERYELIAELGKGGMSSVYLARDLTLDSYWAVKEVKNNSSMEFDAFKKEVELLAALNHPDIPRIVDRIEIGENFYVVMDFIDGSSLSKLLLANGPQPEKLVVEWAKMLCDVLQYLHTTRGNPIVYRDLKPDNIMLAQSGRIKLIDFGIAKEIPHGQECEGKNIGTRGYAAPEQYRGGSGLLDERTDIYSLGATLFYLLTGITPEKPPRGVPRLREVAPTFSEGMEYIIARCTADNPDARYQSIDDVRNDLANIERLTRAYRNQMSRRLISFVACFMACFLFAGVGFTGYRGVQAEQEDIYQTAFRNATAAERESNYNAAVEHYSAAIDAKPDDYEAYRLLFAALLPHEGGEGAKEQTKAAIIEMKQRYLDNKQSPMYQDPRLMYLVVRRCIEVEDREFAGYALEYIAFIYESREYRNNVLPAREIYTFEVIARFQYQEVGGDYVAFQAALDSLDDFTGSADLSTDDRLSNYYILIRMYSTYPSQLTDAYNRVYDLGTRAKALLDASLTNEELSFNNVIPMYELVATQQYNGASYYALPVEKERSYVRSLEWFGYLDGLRVELTEDFLLKKANAHKGIFDLHNTPQNAGQMNEEHLAHLDGAIRIYQQVLENNPNSFLAQLYLCQAYLDREYLKPEAEQDFSLVLQSYRVLTQLYNSNTQPTPQMIAQYNALTDRLRGAGLEV